MRQSSVVGVVLLALLWAPVGATDAHGGEPSADVLEGVQLIRNGDEYTDFLNLLIERGGAAPAVELLSLPTATRVTLRIEGPAQFSYHSDGEGLVFVNEISYEMDKVALPTLLPGAVESRLFIEVKGQETWSPILIRGVDAGHVRQFLTKPFFSKMVLRASAERGFALVDASRVDWDLVKRETDSPEPPGPNEVCIQFGPEQLGDAAPSPLEECSEEPHVCPSNTWYLAPPLYPFPENNCSVNVFWDGQFIMNGGVQPGYSYLHEDGGNLRHVTKITTRWVDGIYWTGWGCQKAFKIPNNVIAVLYQNGSAWCCRGLVAQALGKNCSFVVPGSGAEAGWPQCPLQ